MTPDSVLQARFEHEDGDRITYSALKTSPWHSPDAVVCSPKMAEAYKNLLDNNQSNYMDINSVEGEVNFFKMVEEDDIFEKNTILQRECNRTFGPISSYMYKTKGDSTLYGRAYILANPEKFKEVTRYYDGANHSYLEYAEAKKEVMSQFA